MTPQGVIVTGGTGALGRVVVKQLLARGDRVAVPYRSSGGFEALRSAAGHSAALWGAEADLADVETARRFVDTAAAWLGRLDGPGTPGPTGGHRRRDRLALFGTRRLRDRAGAGG